MHAKWSRRHLVWGACVLTLLAVVAVVIARPYLASTANGQARIYLATRDYPRSLFWLRLSRQLQSTNPQTEILLAQVRRKQDRLADARQHLDRARSLGGVIEHQEWLIDAQAGNLPEAMPHLDELLQDTSGEMPDICESYAIGLIRSRSHIDIAYRLLATWSAEYPNDPQPHFLLAQLCLEFQDLNRGLQELGRALEIDPSHPGAANSLGEYRLSRQQPSDALPLFQIAETGEAERNAALLGQASCLRLFGHRAAARDILSGLLAQNPDDPRANLVLATLEIEDGELEAAIRRLQGLKSSQPYNPDVLQELAAALRGTEQVDQAAEESERAAQIRAQLSLVRHLTRQLLMNPNNLQLRHQIGQLYLALGDEEPGIVWLQSALYLDPRFTPSLLALVQHYENKSDPTGNARELAEEYRRRLQNNS